MAVAHIIAPSWRTADFGDGTTPVAWTSPLDPGETKAYTIDCSRELVSTENRIETVNVVLDGLAVLAGLRIQDQSFDRSHITLWLTINPADRTRSSWDGPGETHYMTCTINITDGQRFERDIALRIRQLGQT